MTDFIANTKRKKLKRLLFTSKTLIREFGIVYFLQIALREIAKQKFKLFSPDIPPSFNYVELSMDYRLVLYNQLQDNLGHEKSNLSAFSYTPRITLFIFYRPNVDLIELKKSIYSITNQIYDKFDIIVINLSDTDLESDFLTKSNNHKINIIKATSTLSLKKLLSYTSNEIIGLLDDSIILQNDLFYRVVEKLNQNNDLDLFYFDEDYMDANEHRKNPFFKPDWSPYLFNSMNYLGRFCIFKKQILDKIDAFIYFDNDFTYDILIRYLEITNKICHIPLPLFSIKSYVYPKSSEHFKNSISNHFKKINIDVNVVDGNFPGTYRVIYKLESEPKVSIIIPTKDKKELLQRCIESLESTNYKNFEIIIIDNNSEDPKTIKYLESLSCQIIRYTEPFNFSKMNNEAVKKSSGEYLLFLNDDTAALEPNWLSEMVSICQQSDVGAVGAKLVHADDTIQHAGMVFLKTGAGFHPFQRYPQDNLGYHNLANVIREFSAVTGACLLTKRAIFDKIGGFDNDFDLYYGDSDLCLKIRDAGYRIVYTPYAKLLHEGSASIRKHSDAFFTVENHYHFIKKWPFLKNGDPFYSIHLGWNYNLEVLPSQMYSLL